MNISDSVRYRRERLALDLQRNRKKEATASYQPMLAEVHFENISTGANITQKYSIWDILSFIPPQHFGYFWHEFTHHLQFIATTQGIRSLLALYDHLNLYQVSAGFMHELGQEESIPWRDYILNCNTDHQLLPIIKEWIHRSDDRMSGLFGEQKRFHRVGVAPPARQPKQRVYPEVFLLEHASKHDPSKSGLLVDVTLANDQLGRAVLDVLSLREGMAWVAENVHCLNVTYRDNPAMQQEYRRLMEIEAWDDDLITYYVLYGWWAVNCPKKHQSMPTFLALCEIASMYDAVVNEYCPENLKLGRSVPALPPCGYFLFLVSALRLHSDDIHPIDESNSAIFVDSILNKLKWPDLQTQAATCLTYLDSFRDRHKNLLLGMAYPFERMQKIFEYRQSVLGNGLLLFKAMHPDGIEAQVEAMNIVGFPGIYFSDAAFVDPNTITIRTITDIANKLFWRSAFSCRFWEENRPQHCKIYRKKGCEGNPFPGGSATRFQTCIAGKALLGLMGESMARRQWRRPVPEDWIGILAVRDAIRDK